MNKVAGTQSNPNRRKAMGVHYTPPLLARFLADRLAGSVRQSGDGAIRILDPACGAGVLLEALLRSLEDAGRLCDCEVIGVDADRGVLSETRSRLEMFEKVRCRLIPADFLDLVSSCRRQAELWATMTPDGDFEDTFDIVIANPPYVRTQILGAEKAQRLASRYSLTGRVDLYHVFLVAVTQTIRPGGHLGIITSNRFLSTLAGTAIRSYLAWNYDIEEAIDLGDTKLFEAAVLPAIFIGRRRQECSHRQIQTQPRFMKIYSQPDRSDEKLEDFRAASDVLGILRQGQAGLYRTPKGVFRLTTGELLLGNDPKGVWSLTTRKEAAWLARVCKAAWKLFKDIAVVRVGIKTTANDVFIRSDWDLLPPKVRPEPELLRPLLRHEDARCWSIPDEDQPRWRVLYPHEVRGGKRRPVDLNRYPGARAYLKSHRERLKKRHYVTKAGRLWYEIWVPQDPKAWSTPKIVFPDISPEPRFYLDHRGRIVDGDCYWITLRPGTPSDVLYLLLALANSTLMTRFHDLAFSNKLYSGRRRYITQYVGQYPCPDPTLPASKKLIALAKEMVLETNSDGNQARVQSICAQVEILVQEAFGMNPDEQLT